MHVKRTGEKRKRENRERERERERGGEREREYVKSAATAVRKSSGGRNVGSAVTVKS